MAEEWSLEEALSYYREGGAPRDQQALVSLLREIQQETGALTQEALDAVVRAYDVRPALLHALLRRTPDLRLSDAPHRLELCMGPSCRSRGAMRLKAFVEKTWDVRDGRSERGRFTLSLVPCQRRCAKGPCARWDGTALSPASEDGLRALIENDAGKGRDVP